MARRYWPRRNRRVLFCIKETKGRKLKVIVPQFNTREKVWISKYIIPRHLQSRAVKDEWFFAFGTILKMSPLRFKFSGIKLAPELNPNDGLA